MGIDPEICQCGARMVVDDVITAGTAIREVMDLLQRTGATPAGILVALDRQEHAWRPGMTMELSPTNQAPPLRVKARKRNY